jgi:hypothetical protein
MRVLLHTVLLLFTFTACQSQAEPLADYPAPKRVDSGPGSYTFPGWEVDLADRLIARADDPASPRVVQVTVADAQNMSFDEAIRRALNKEEVIDFAYPTPEQLEVSTELVGGKEFITIGTSTRGGHPATLVIIAYENPKTNGAKIIKFYETPTPIYESWGGIAAIMMGQGVIDDVTVFPEDKRQEIATASPRQQTSLFEAAYTQIMMAYAQGIMMTQANTTLQMMELNYDLLFDNDIVDPYPGN